VKASIDNIARDARERTTCASQALGRQGDGLHAALRQNPAWRTLDARPREHIRQQIDRLIERQQRHLQERWDRTSDFADQLDEIAARLADEQEAERDSAPAAADLDKRHLKQASELADLAVRTEESIATLMRADDDRMEEERATIAGALATASADTMEAAFKRSDQDRSPSWRMYLDLRRLEQDVDRGAQNIFVKRTRRRSRGDRRQRDD
jgi:hypothetical protein